MRFETRHAFRYLRSRRGGLARLTTFASFAGIAFSVACLIVVQAIYTGYRNGIEKGVLSDSGHITISDNKPGEIRASIVAAQIKRIENVKSVKPVMIRAAMISGFGKRGYTILNVINEKGDAGLKGVSVGRNLAESLGIRAGDSIKILVPDEDAGGANFTEFRVLKIAGSLGTSSFTLEMNAEEYTAFGFETPPVTDTYFVQLNRPFETESTGAELSKSLGPSFSLQTWQTQNRSFLEALELENRVASTVFLIMILIASLCVAATLSLLVNERRLDIAVLKICGAASRSLALMFLIEGVVIGLAATSAGIVLGLVACAVVNQTDVLNVAPDVYTISRLVLAPEAGATVLIAAGSLLLILPSILIPVFRASKLKPAEIFRRA